MLRQVTMVLIGGALLLVFTSVTINSEPLTEEELSRRAEEELKRLDNLLPPPKTTVTPRTSAIPAWSIEFYRAKEGAVAHEESAKDSSIIYRFQPEEEFKVIGKEEGGWLKVRFSNQVAGYVKEGEAAPVFSLVGSSGEAGKGEPFGEPQGVIVKNGRMIKWGASQDEAKLVVAPHPLYHCRTYGKDEPDKTLCLIEDGVDFGGGDSYDVFIHFYKDRFFLYFVQFPSEEFSFVADATERRLGKPTKSKKSIVQNRMGANFDQTEKLWSLTNTKVEIVKRRSSKLSEGEMTVIYLPISKEVTTKPGKAPF